MMITKTQRHGLTPLTESALLAALTVVMAMIAVYIPVIGMLASLVWALPIVVLTVRHGLRQGIMALLVSGLIMAMLIEPLLSLRMVLSFGLPGIVLGVCFQREYGGAKTLGITMASSVAAKIMSLMIVLAVTGLNPLSMSVDALKESFDMTFSIYSGLGADEAALNATKEDMDESVKMFSLLMPLVIVLMGAVDTTVNYVVAGRVMKRLGHFAPTLPPFIEWRLPIFFLYLSAFSLIGLYWGTTREIASLYQASLNCYMLTVFAGLLQGFSLVYYVADRFNLGTFWLVLITLVILLSGILTQVLSFTGLFDMFFDYRRRFGGGTGR